MGPFPPECCGNGTKAKSYLYSLQNSKLKGGKDASSLCSENST